MKSPFEKRLRRLESKMRVGAEELPAIFIMIADASVPDPECDEAACDFSDACIVGFTFGTGRGREHRITRRDGESCEALEHRAGIASPNTRVFFAAYRESSEKFNTAMEWAQ